MTSSVRSVFSTAVLLFTLPALCATTHHKPAHPAAHTTAHHTTAHRNPHTTSARTTRHGAHLSRASFRGRSRAATHHLPVVAMDTERATQIQTALIKQGYLTGEPTGNWDAASIAAMQKLQSDNGWQTKIMPDSRALIKLGLGPQNPGQ